MADLSVYEITVPKIADTADPDRGATVYITKTYERKDIKIAEVITKREEVTLKFVPEYGSIDWLISLQ